MQQPVPICARERNSISCVHVVIAFGTSSGRPMENRDASGTTVKRHTPLGVSQNGFAQAFRARGHLIVKLVNGNENAESVTFAGLYRDPYLFINDRGFHILAHCYSMAPYPSNAISGHGESASNGDLFKLWPKSIAPDSFRLVLAGFSEDGLTWHWSNVEPYDNTVPADGTVQHFATMERPKFICENLCCRLCSPVAVWAECEAMLYPQSQMPTKNIHCVQHTCSTESPLCGIARTCATLVQHVVIVARARSTREETGRTPSHGNSVGESLSGSNIALPCHLLLVGRRVLHCLERRLQKQRS